MIRFNERQWNEIKSNMKFITRGSQGEVHRVRLFNKDYAVKIFKEEEDFVKEVEYINNCSSEFVVKIFGITSTPEAIFMDWYSCDLESYIIDKQPSFEETVKIMSDISKAVAYVHYIGYIHLDIRPKNFLIKQGKCVICDFGVAIEDVSPHNHKRAVDCWVAPEISFGTDVSTKTDIYSMGLVFWFITSSKGSYPFHNTATSEMIKASFKSKDRPQWRIPKNKIEKGICELTKKCWREQMDTRPTAKRISKAFEKWVSELTIDENIIDE